MGSLSHVNNKGEAHMVDVSAKPISMRTALASGKITLSPEAIALVRANGIAKGDVLATARIAGIMAAKHASTLIPLCHNINLDQVTVNLRVDEDGIYIEGSVRSVGRTGAEMEALTAVSVAALSIYDMCKAIDKSMTIGGITLVEKRKTSV